MQRIINNPDLVVEDMLKGYVKAHANLVRGTDNPRVVVSAFPKKPGKVGIVTGGGSGHKPAFVGYVGRNMVDAVAVGPRCSPRPPPSPSTTRFARGGRRRGRRLPVRQLCRRQHEREDGRQAGR